MAFDAGDTGSSSNYLKRYYEGANRAQRSTINETFVALCGWSYETLLEMKAKSGKENGGRGHPAP